MHFDKKGEVGKAKGSHLLCYIENTTDQGESVNKEKDENQKTFLPKYYMVRLTEFPVIRSRARNDFYEP